jgi:diguanylate cyclase (GGDEF)-like protein/PAS domain S-box-containing protein
MTSTSISGRPLVMDDADDNGHTSSMTGGHEPPDTPRPGADVFDAAAVGMALLDLDGRYVRVNRAFCDLLGYAADDLDGTPFSALTHPDDVTLGQEALRRLVLGRSGSFQFEKRSRRRDGRVVWLLLAGSLVPASAETPARVLVAAQDISERKWAEEALVTQNATMRLLQQATVAANEAGTLNEAVAALLPAVCEHAGWPVGHLWLRAPAGGWAPAPVWHGEGNAHYDRLRGVTDAVRLPADGGLPGAVALDGAPRWTPDIAAVAHPAAAQAAAAAGLRAAFAFPVLVGTEVAAVLEFFASTTFPPDGSLLDALAQVGAQLGSVVERERAAVALRASEERSRRIIETAGDAFVEMDAEGRITDWNRRAEEIFGWTRAEAIGRELSETLVPERYRAAHTRWLQRLFETGEAPVFGARLELTALHREGRELPVELTIWPVDTAGHGWRFGAFLHDISGRLAAQEALREAQERFKKAFDNAPIGMALVGLDGRFQEVNRALCEMLGYAEATLLASDAAAITHPDDVTVGADLRHRAEAGELAAYTVEKRYVRADGRTVWGLLSVSVVTDSHSRPRHFVSQLEDITERKEAEAVLTWRALHDPLTGLANRTLFLDRVTQALSRRERRPSSLAVLFCDLDGFKDVNDGLGHESGDAVLTTVAERLRGAVRPSDTVARLGGDEFVILCEDLGGEREALAIAQRLEAALADPVPLPDGDVTVTASVGVALATSAHTDAHALLRDADSAMYRAKEAGKARCELFDAPSPTPRVTTDALRVAVDEARLRLLYQPTVDLGSGAVVSVEALLRYVAADGHLLGPDAFLDVAEDTGLIVTMGAWALGEAYRQCVRWRVLRPHPALRVSVNLSARQLARPDFADLVRRTLAGAGVEAETLALEVSENVLLRAGSAALRGLTALHGTGVRLSLDDFGAGVGAVGHVARGLMHEVKIDRSLVAGLGKQAEDTAAVTGIIGLGRALGLTTVAEGVETAEQADLLRDLGCDLAQGYFFASPQPPDAIDALLAAAAA